VPIETAILDNHEPHQLTSYAETKAGIPCDKFKLGMLYTILLIRLWGAC